MGAMSSTLMKMMFPKKEMLLVLEGLNSVGKTSILKQLKNGELVANDFPTIGFNVETLEYKNLCFIVYDVGGQFKFVETWKHCIRNTVGLMYIVDSTNRERIEEARDELHNMLNLDEQRNATLLVFANKQDLPNAMSVAQITDILGLSSIHHHRWHIQAGCATSGEGLRDGLDWLYYNLIAITNV